MASIVDEDPTSYLLEICQGRVQYALDVDDDPAEQLEAISVLARAVERAQTKAVHRLLDRGATWTEVGRRLGVTRQAATQRYGGA